MNPQLYIGRFIKRSTWAMVVMAVARGILQASIALIPFFVALVLLDHFVELSAAFRKGIWFIGVGGGLFFFVHGFWPFSIFKLKSRSRSLSMARKNLREDDLQIAYDFVRASDSSGVSADFKNDYLSRITQQLRASSLAHCFPLYPWKKIVVAVGCLLFICGTVFAFFPGWLPASGRVLFPFVSAQLRDFIEVRPGNAQVPFGTTVKVELKLKAVSVERPKLFVKGEGDWVEASADDESANHFYFELKNVVRPLSYRVFWKGEWGEKYVLRPVEPLRINDFEITISPPSYLGAPSKTQNTPEITGLAGSDVRLTAKLSQTVSDALLQLPDNEQIKLLVNKQTVEGRFTLQKNGTYGFSFSQNRYPLQILPDEAPKISLLSPAEDLIVGLKDRLPITYEASDDMGLGEITLIFEKEREGLKKRRIKTFSETTPNALSTYDWDLNAEDFKPGDVFRFQIEAADKNTVTGPSRAQSEWRLIEIASFEKSHETIAQVLEAWREKALDLLGDVNTTKAALDKENADIPQVAASHMKSMQNSQEMESVLEKIVAMMEKDPLADYDVWLEHKEMAENMELMNNGLMQQANASLQTKNKEQASRAMEQISSELERMLALSEDLSKKQRASDVMELGDNLEKLGEDMVRQMEAMANAAPAEQNEMAKAVNRMLAEANSYLQQLAKAVQQFPQELPEDFVNQEALKNLEVEKSNDILSQIQEAMKQGDYQKAMSLAKQYLEAAKKMSEQLSEAYNSYTESHSAEKLAEEMQQKMEKLDEISKKQQENLAETQKIESERLKQMMAEQEKFLDQLFREQAAVLERADRIVVDKNYNSQIIMGMASEITAMKMVRDEFEVHKVQRAPDLLNRIVMSLNNTQLLFSSSTASVPGLEALRDVLKREQEIAEKLKNPSLPNTPPTDDQMKKMSSLKNSQNSLSKETQALKRDLQVLSRKSASLNMSVTEPLSNAASAMERAGKQLGEGKSRDAQKSEEEALSQLGAARESLAGAEEMMSGMQGQSGRPGGSSGSGPRVIVRPGGTGGRGVQTGKVRLPTMNDYKPPREFREELLDSLKEKYPKAYEEIIHKYYKRLTD